MQSVQTEGGVFVISAIVDAWQASSVLSQFLGGLTLYTSINVEMILPFLIKPNNNNKDEGVNNNRMWRSNLKTTFLFAAEQQTE